MKEDFGGSAVVGAEVGADVGNENEGRFAPGIGIVLVVGGESVISILSSNSCGTAVAVGVVGSFFGSGGVTLVPKLNPDDIPAPKTGGLVSDSFTVPFIVGGSEGATTGEVAPNTGFDFSASGLLNAPPNRPNPPGVPNTGVTSFFASLVAWKIGAAGDSVFG